MSRYIIYLCIKRFNTALVGQMNISLFFCLLSIRSMEMYDYFFRLIVNKCSTLGITFINTIKNNKL